MTDEPIPSAEAITSTVGELISMQFRMTRSPDGAVIGEATRMLITLARQHYPDIGTGEKP